MSVDKPYVHPLFHLIVPKTHFTNEETKAGSKLMGWNLTLIGFMTSGQLFGSLKPKFLLLKTKIFFTVVKET